MIHIVKGISIISDAEVDGPQVGKSSFSDRRKVKCRGSILG